MFYSLLGRTVWYGLKLYLRQRRGASPVPKALLAACTVAAGVGVTVAVLRARSED